IYTTPSPFLVPRGEVSKIRVVSRDEEGYTTIRETTQSDLEKDEVIRKTLGIELSDSYLVNKRTLIVEGPIDKTILHFMNRKLHLGQNLPEEYSSLELDKTAEIIAGSIILQMKKKEIQKRQGCFPYSPKKWKNN
ncbi:MAG: hypothetical protein BRC26_04150, partial [Nanohaloarchaea archaeon QH_8_44_6]